MYLRARKLAPAGILFIISVMNNVNQARGSLLNGDGTNGVSLNEGSKTTLNTSTQKASSETSSMDFKCSNFKLSPVQPVFNKHSQIRKCCPFGQNLEETENDRLQCVTGNKTVDVKVIYAEFYGDSECIDDKEHDLHFIFVSYDSCIGSNSTFLYSKKQNDELFVIQNGSLLVLTDGNSMVVFNIYCVDMDSNGQLLAKACDVVGPIVVKATATMIYTGMVIASIALVITIWAYAFVPRLNDTFGYLLVGHAGTFLVGMILMTLAVCGDRCLDHGAEELVRIIANVFLIASIMAFFGMNIHNYAYAICYLPQRLELSMGNKRYVYIFSAFLFTIVTVLLLQPWRNLLIFNIQYSYYAAIAVVLFLSQRALNRLKESVQFHRYAQSQGANMETTILNSQINKERLEDIMSLNRLCQAETGFTLLCWIVLDWLQQHTSRREDFYRIAAAYGITLQGMLIGVFFVAERKRWSIICNYWTGNSKTSEMNEESPESQELTNRENEVVSIGWVSTVHSGSV